MLKNQHALFVKYHGPSNAKGSRISITSKRFNSRVVFSFPEWYNTTIENAEVWLKLNGYVLTGKFENGNEGYVITSNTFECLKLTLGERIEHRARQWYANLKSSDKTALMLNAEPCNKRELYLNHCREGKELSKSLQLDFILSGESLSVYKSVFTVSKYEGELRSYSETLAQIVCLVYESDTYSGITWFTTFRAKYGTNQGQIEDLNLLIKWAKEFENLYPDSEVWDELDWYETVSQFIHTKIFGD